MEKKNIIYVIYVILILSVTAFLSHQILSGSIKTLSRLGKIVEIIPKVKTSQEDKLIFHLKNIKKNLESCMRTDEPFYNNSLGFRDLEWKIEKYPNNFRILAIGDSFTGDDCVDINDSWPKQLERKLNYLDLPMNFEILNMGKGGRGTFEEVEIFKKTGLKYTSDMVVLQYFYNDYVSPEVQVRADELWEKYKRGEYKLPSKVEAKIKELNITNLVVSELIYLNTYDEYFENHKNFEDEWKSWVKKPLEELIEICKDKNISLIVILMPDLFSGEDLSYDLTISLLEEYDILYIDFSEILPKHPISLVARSDGHLTPYGYEIVANKTLNTISELIIKVS